MKLSINWLKTFLNLDEVTPKEVAHKLTMGAFEVEEIKTLGCKLEGPVVVGKILDIQNHPNADKLSIARVTTDGKNELQIVCGAKNIKVGQKVPVSLPGAVVVNRHDGSKLPIKITKIREIESFGMLCTPRELGVTADDSGGILILEDNAKLGQSILDYLSLCQDIVLEVQARSNRGDALSVYGLSKEISALTRKELKKIDFKAPKANKSVQNVLSKIEDAKDTYVFYTATIENITICESPAWLKNLLESVGIRSVSNIVDITNYINFSFGQPLHAYDRSKLSGKSLTSRLAKKGERIVTLDGKTQELNESILVIADEKKPVAISGIMGGKDSEVTETTKDIVIEAAVFNPVRVRRASRSIGLSSEASKRFERGVDSSFTYKALLKTIELIGELSPQDKKPKVGEICQAGKPTDKEVKIQLPLGVIRRVLGVNLKANEVIKLLESLGFRAKSHTEGKIEIIAPSSRLSDISRPIDLVEEVARLYGYDQIKALPPPATLSSAKTNFSIEKIKANFLQAGFTETYLSSLVGEQLLNIGEFPFDKTKAISMINPLSREHCVLRQCLIPGLLEALKLNQVHQTLNVKLFEIGKVYFSNPKGRLSEKETGVTENSVIAGVMCSYEESYLTEKKSPDKLIEFQFFKVKGIIENLLVLTNSKFTFYKVSKDFLHPNFALGITLDKIDIGSFGYLHPQIEKRLELLGPVMVFEISLGEIANKLQGVKMFEKISSQPVVERDITIDLSKKYEASTVISEIKKVISSFVTNVNLISLYELDKENKSLTYRLRMQDFEQTLTSKKIDEEVNKIKNHLSSCLQAKFRV